MEGIQVSVEKIGPQNDISIIRVGGYIDTTTSSELERALDSLLKAGIFRVIIDLANVDYISSAGWGIFISEIKGIRERGGDLKLACMIPDVYEVFELLEFHYILKAFDSVDEAQKSFLKEKGVMTLDEEEAPAEPPPFQEEEQEPETQPIPEGMEEKVRMIALEHPDWGASQISKELKTAKYGYLNCSSFNIWRMLRKMNLGNRKQRNDYD